MNAQFRPLQTPPPSIEQRPRVTGPAGFVHRKRAASPAALVFSMLATAALIGLILTVSVVAERVRPSVDRLIVIAVKQVSAQEDSQPEEKPVVKPRPDDDIPDEGSPASRERTIAPAPDLPDPPEPDHNLAATQVPATPVTGDEPKAIAGADSKGDQPTGVAGPGGQGGDGIAGTGNGGTGNGNGKGSGARLTASWAPDMDFSILQFYYPRSALKAKIEGSALLNCYVPRFGEVRRCKLLGESPSGNGFGRAALKARRSYRIQIHDQSGRRVYNDWVVIRAHFIVPNKEDSAAESEP